MKESGAIPELSLFGGPLHWLGRRLGLVRGGTNTVRLGLALGTLAWGVLLLLALMEGHGPKVFSLGVIGIHVRFLVAVPLFFLCETWVFFQMAEFVRYIVSSGVVPETSLPELDSDIRRVRRMADSWLAEVVFLVAACALPLIEMVAQVPVGRTGSWASILHGGGFTWTSGWYLGFCLPLFRFLVLRWLWRLGIWWYFLWHLANLDIRLVPTHSDGAAGLGYLEIVHEQFAPLVLAISAVYSAQFAEDISSGAMAFESLYRLAPVLMLPVAALFIGPLVIFFPKLRTCRWTGMREYMVMASRYVTAFEDRWIRDPEASGESLLGAADLQSLADLTNSVNVVRGLRSIPAGERLVLGLAAALILPLLPLLLLKYPLDQVAARLFQMLTGL
jgi:hypothetical protein